MKSFFLEEKAQGEWSSVYMLLILVIAAIALIAVIKPMFQQSQKLVKKTTPTTSN
jgi:competence protein ComGC